MSESKPITTAPGKDVIFDSEDMKPFQEVVLLLFEAIKTYFERRLTEFKTIEIGTIKKEISQENTSKILNPVTEVILKNSSTLTETNKAIEEVKTRIKTAEAAQTKLLDDAQKHGMKLEEQKKANTEKENRIAKLETQIKQEQDKIQALQKQIEIFMGNTEALDKLKQLIEILNGFGTRLAAIK